MQIVLASNNAGKLAELRTYLQPLTWDIQSQQEANIAEIEETGLSFIENALIKARHACEISGLAAIADDSGLEVDALQGAPGIYSARYAGVNARDHENVAKLLKEMINVPQEKRLARYHCVLVYMRHAYDPVPIIAQGCWEGSILFNPVGDKGFGYDPIFYVPTHDCSAAQLNPKEKNRISHRGLAMAGLLKQLQIIF
jgi:XTP/dITP diphosphohydrolase